jgi:capsular exopolysaccharide synthesis family protein
MAPDVPELDFSDLSSIQPDVVQAAEPELSEPDITEPALEDDLPVEPESPAVPLKGYSPASTAPAIDFHELTTAFAKPPSPGYLVTLTDEHGEGAEKFRILATRLWNIRRESRLQALQVTSSTPGEGKTLVSSNLAVALAKRADQTVLLIEGDLRKPAVCPMFGLSAHERGLGDWWGETDPDIMPFLQRVADTTLCLLPAGEVHDPAAMLQSSRMASLIQQLAGWFDWIVIDTPSILPATYANLWTSLVDGTLLVIREGGVRQRALRSAVNSMQDHNLVGLVLNDAPDAGYAAAERG